MKLCVPHVKVTITLSTWCHDIFWHLVGRSSTAINEGFWASVQWFQLILPKSRPVKLILFNSLKMISSLYCAVSEPNVYKHYKWLTRWNANRCHSLRTIFLIFETFQILFRNSFINFYSCEGFHLSDISERMKHKA